jgi:hypothetical protein
MHVHWRDDNLPRVLNNFENKQINVELNISQNKGYSFAFKREKNLV